MEIDAILKEVPLFRQLSEPQIHKLAQESTRLTFADGQIVFREGDTSVTMYVILDGQVKVSKQDQQGIEVIIDQLSRGEFFGEMALVSNEPRSATIITESPCDFLIIERPLFLDLIANAGSEVTFRFLDYVIAKIRQLSDRFFNEELARQTLENEMKLASQRSLTQMVAGIAHELNTPLGTANTSASILQRILNSPDFATLHQQGRAKSDLDDVLEAVQLIERNIARAHKLVENFKKVSVSQLTETLEPLDLPEVVSDAVGLYKTNAKLARLMITIIDDIDANKTWVGFRGYLTQVLLNFLTNAERYAYEPGIGGKIDILLESATQDGVAMFVMTVKDFGKGIPPENLPKIFDPFFTTGRSKGGTGLGMAIVHNIVTSAFHGSIRVTSELQKGTTFIVTFPQVIYNPSANP